MHMQGESAASLLNRALFALESACHPTFRGLATSAAARLPYPEGRNALFYGAASRRVRALVLRGCTRTALEWAKMVLSLDREDPVGMLFYIDYCALRSRQCAFNYLLDTSQCDLKQLRPCATVRARMCACWRVCPQMVCVIHI